MRADGSLDSALRIGARACLHEPATMTCDQVLRRTIPVEVARPTARRSVIRRLPFDVAARAVSAPALHLVGQRQVAATDPAAAPRCLNFRLPLPARSRKRAQIA